MLTTDQVQILWDWAQFNPFQTSSPTWLHQVSRLPFFNEKGKYKTLSAIFLGFLKHPNIIVRRYQILWENDFNLSLFGNVGVSFNRWIRCPNEVVLQGGDPNHLRHLQGLLFLDGVIIAYANYFRLGSENYSLKIVFDFCWKSMFSEKLLWILIFVTRHLFFRSS